MNLYFDKKRTFQITPLLLFLGSVFITSEKFVIPTNSPKNYFVQVSLLFFVVFAVLSPKQKVLQGLRNRAMLWGISVVCFLQAGLGFIQYVGWFPSNHSGFPITGSFDNPAGFAAVLSLGFPVGAFLFIREKGIGKYFSLLITVAIALLVSLSGSRTGVIAIVSLICGIVSFWVFACFSYPSQYAAVWFLLAYFLSALFSEIQQPAIGNIYLKLMCRSIVCVACAFALVHVYKQIRSRSPFHESYGQIFLTLHT